MRLVAALILTSIALGGCANQGLRDLRNTTSGPDEFIVQPAKPLEAPDSYSALPVPTPGAANRTDRYPLREGIAAFGGQAEDPDAPIPARDGALVNHVSRLGVNPGIRTTLAETDADFRRRKARFTQIRIVPTDRYNDAYKRQALDARKELNRWRRAGARTPSAPPAE